MATENLNGLEGTSHYYLEGGSSVVEDARLALIGKYTIVNQGTIHEVGGSISEIDALPTLAYEDRIRIGAMIGKPALH